MMLEDIKGEQATKIHRRMHAPISQDVVVHVNKVQDMTMRPRNQRILGNSIGDNNTRQAVNLAKIDEQLNARKEEKPEQSTRPTAKEIKEQEIQKALNIASKKYLSRKEAKKAKKARKSDEMTFGFRRMVLAMVCAAAAVFAIVYFVNLNATDISLKVTAMQTGIEASYPSYIPRDYSLSDITSENGKIIMNFRNSSSGDAYTLTEEASSWDSTALLNNYVKGEFGDNYTILKEQGLTINVSNSDATWVNGGILFRIKTTSGSLTKKQIQTIATSL